MDILNGMQTKQKIERDSNELEIYLFHGASLARKGIVVAAYGFCQFNDMRMVLGDFGFRPSSNKLPEKAEILPSKTLCENMARSWEWLAAQARKERVIGIGGVILMKDGTAEIVAVGSLSGMRLLINAFLPELKQAGEFRPERRSVGYDRRSAGSPYRKSSHSGHSS